MLTNTNTSNTKEWNTHTQTQFSDFEIKGTSLLKTCFVQQVYLDRKLPVKEKNQQKKKKHLSVQQ